MGYREDERRWKRIQDMLAAEAGGKELKPMMSQRTLFGIPSTMEQTIDRIVAEDERNRRLKRHAADGRVEHPLDPIFDERSRVLVLGTMPSPKSREVGFYYGHPQNRFWRVMAALFDEPVASTNDRRRDQMLRHHIALWDVLASCDIEGASDASIANAVANDLSRVLDCAPIEAVFCTGTRAAELYSRLCASKTGVPCVKLPSTSAANAAMRLDDLVAAYRDILPFLHEFVPGEHDVARVVELERAIDARGTSLAELMERAGLALAHRVDSLVDGGRVAVLCGSGNNGGDGWVAARDLAERGHEVALVSERAPEELRAQPAHDAALVAFEELDRAGARVLIRPSTEDVREVVNAADVVVDALLGTGFSGGGVKEPYAEWIRIANERREAGALTVSADVPSGLSAQTGEAGVPCIIADETVTMIVPKPGLSVSDVCGRVSIAPLAYIEPIVFPAGN